MVKARARVLDPEAQKAGSPMFIALEGPVRGRHRMHDAAVGQRHAAFVGHQNARRRDTRRRGGHLRRLAGGEEPAARIVACHDAQRVRIAMIVVRVRDKYQVSIVDALRRDWRWPQTSQTRSVQLLHAIGQVRVHVYDRRT